jgi:hypothetical protein
MVLWHVMPCADQTRICDNIDVCEGFVAPDAEACLSGPGGARLRE